LSEQPYNPLDKNNLGASVAEAMLGREVHELGKLSEFHGAGIYAIYYTGTFDAYKLIRERNSDGKWQAPIYVGKAVPAGARKGKLGLNSADETTVLFKRLREHAESIKAASNLDIKHFHCRYLIVDDIWIPLGESLLIAKFAPLWNTLVDGFGNHDPGGGRYQGLRPRWDVLHPGRVWAAKCKERQESAEQIKSDVVRYIKASPKPESRPSVFEEKADY
jgi:Eco29kI restriction endonuclease